jgi:hypothetical protein
MTKLFLTALLLAATAAAVLPGTVDDFMREGRVKEALTQYATPSDDAGWFSLGLLQALDGLQQFSAGMHKLGLNPSATRNVPFFRVVWPRPVQEPPEPASPEKVARLFTDFRSSLRRAKATLTRVGDQEFGVTVNLSQLRLDMDGDGACSPDERLLAVLGQTLGLSNTGGPDLVVRFDSADAAWLKAYTHLLGGMLDLLLAYDWSPVWKQCAHIVFLNPDPKPALTQFIHREGGVGPDFPEIADMIAAVHDMRLNLVDKDGPRRARDEFQKMVAGSRTCWQRVLAETDDQGEWLPSPRQTGPGGTKISQEQIDAWKRVLDELDAIASGTKLLPHWRMKSGIGINVQKLVASPPVFDLVLMIQGSAFVPYLEEGAVSDRASWNQLTRAFGGGFFRFAIWSN